MSLKKIGIGLLIGAASVFGFSQKDNLIQVSPIQQIQPISQNDVVNILLDLEAIIEEFAKAKRQTWQMKRHIELAQESYKEYTLAIKKHDNFTAKEHERNIKVNINQLKTLLEQEKESILVAKK